MFSLDGRNAGFDSSQWENAADEDDQASWLKLYFCNLIDRWALLNTRASEKLNVILCCLDEADDDEAPASSTTPNTPAYSSAAAAEIEAQKKVRIGCCNGLPYTNNKRCCCRRAAFDKDSKFCCAINGCENFRIFERTENNYSACQSLQGLVVQEYGYTGQWAHLGEPDFTKEQRPEPSQIRHPYRARYPYGKSEDASAAGSDSVAPTRPTRPTRPVRG
ncbi:unnamed protein product [Oikopleura dioica]|uniref:Uncharacterized protein n=1 Tax=Oikopleura dioica TaxID=34765 RepID=E4WYY0_OIKDI|nr:unnamed protein product [Oikopleura dioica]